MSVIVKKYSDNVKTCWRAFTQRISGTTDWGTFKRQIPRDGQSPLNASAVQVAAQRAKTADPAEWST